MLLSTMNFRSLTKEETIYALNHAAATREFMYNIPDPDQSKYPGIKNFKFSLACLTHFVSAS